MLSCKLPLAAFSMVKSVIQKCPLALRRAKPVENQPGIKRYTAMMARYILPQPFLNVIAGPMLQKFPVRMFLPLPHSFPMPRHTFRTRFSHVTLLPQTCNACQAVVRSLHAPHSPLGSYLSKYKFSSMPTYQNTRNVQTHTAAAARRRRERLYGGGGYYRLPG